MRIFPSSTVFSNPCLQIFFGKFIMLFNRSKEEIINRLLSVVEIWRNIAVISVLNARETRQVLFVHWTKKNVCFKFLWKLFLSDLKLNLLQSQLLLNILCVSFVQNNVFRFWIFVWTSNDIENIRSRCLLSPHYATLIQNIFRQL